MRRFAFGFCWCGIDGYEHVKLALRQLYQFPVLLLASSPLSNYDRFHLWGKKTSQLARQVLVKQ